MGKRDAELICPACSPRARHYCNFTEQSYDDDITEFECKVCEEKAKYEDGAYVCK